MVLKINSTNEVIMFLEALQKQIKIVNIFADYYPGSVTIRFEGAKEKLKDAIEITKRIHQIVKGKKGILSCGRQDLEKCFVITISGIGITR